MTASVGLQETGDSATEQNAEGLSRDELLDRVQRGTIAYFWDGAHPISCLPYDRRLTFGAARNELISIGGGGFGFMAIVVAVSRGWISRDAATRRLARMVNLLEKVERFHGAFPHFIHGSTGAVIPFSRYDNGGDLVETALLVQGMICAREYFDADTVCERALRVGIQDLVDAVDWAWYTRNSHTLYWHWSKTHGWKMNIPIAGWNEALVTYVLAAGARWQSITRDVFDRGWACDGAIRNGNAYYQHILPVGQPFGGPLFMAHYSFCTLDPRRMTDRNLDYLDQNVAHAKIHLSHCIQNPNSFDGYGEECWGLTASHGPRKFAVSTPDNDTGIIAPTAALSSFPYLPAAAEKALRHYLTVAGGRLWGRYGFVDAFRPAGQWIARTHLAMNQGPIIAMIENYRSGLLWRLFMNAPEVTRGLDRLGIVVSQGLAHLE